MAYKGKVLSNPLTGQDIVFLQTSRDTGGRLLEMESIYAPFSREPVAHYHPSQDEDFEVLEGQLTVKMGGRTQVYKMGERFFVPRGTVHSMWNASGSTTVVNWQVRPAMQTEFLLETSHGLIRDGKTNTRGMPGLLQVALLMNKFSNEFRIAKPPFAVQKVVFGVLTPFAFLAGKKAVYKKYID